ncbi:cytidine deaminase [Ruegeria sp. ANG-R]|uniref:cytidine deaminase n=1 Tax=Ruegeria sp. ANG-R TaxID=1577903 RepID=UPI00057CCE67|nr:cytidine deaminase [Ruegeria sp. ANG-R]KIC43234.1 cytidine deaminase [Ruegeria sp. ANG-R]
MNIEQELYHNATELIVNRYPKGWGGAAAIRLVNGDIVTSVAPETDFDALSVCMELGAFLEAHKRDQRVTHSLCVFRDHETSDFRILTPCGICQERLRFWGMDTLVAITNPENKLIFLPLRDLLPHHWLPAYS